MNVRGAMGDDDGGALPEVLSSSADAPTAEERVRSAVAESGLKGWVRRHRVLLAGSLGVLLVAAGAITYASTRPPPVDLTIGVSVVGFTEGGDNGFDADGRPRRALTYQVTGGQSGDVSTVIGVVGPGLIDPSSDLADVTYGRPGVGYLGATIDCDDPAWWEAEDSDYQAQISRTDEYGRVTVGAVPLGDTPRGPSDTVWHDDVVRTCLSAYFLSLPPPSSVSVSSGDGTQVDITLSFTNPGDHGIQILTNEFALALPLSPSRWTEIPAGGTATLTLSTEAVRGCEGDLAVVPHVLGPDRAVTADRGFPVRLSLVGTPTAEGVVDGTVTVDDREGYGWAVLTPAFADAVDAELAKLCDLRAE